MTSTLHYTQNQFQEDFIFNMKMKALKLSEHNVWECLHDLKQSFLIVTQNIQLIKKKIDYVTVKIFSFSKDIIKTSHRVRNILYIFQQGPSLKGNYFTKTLQMWGKRNTQLQPLLAFLSHLRGNRKLTSTYEGYIPGA